jgi:hypothetical protein
MGARVGEASASPSKGNQLRLRLRSPFRLPVTVTCKELSDDKRSLLITIRALYLLRQT